MSLLIFGILNIGFGLLGLAGPLIGLAFSHMKGPVNPAVEALKADPTYASLTKFNSTIGVVLAIALLAFGIGLLLMQNWARLGSIIYAIFAIVYAPVISMLMWPFTKRLIEQTPGISPGMAGGIAAITLGFGLVLGMGYPILLLIFMTRSKAIEACQPEEPPATPAA